MCKNMTEIENDDFVGFGNVLRIFYSKIPSYSHDRKNIYFDENRSSKKILSNL